MGILHRLRRKAREVGPARLARLLLRRLVPARWFGFTRSVLLELRLEPACSTPGESAGLRWAEEHERELLSSFGHSPDTLAARFAQGDRVCVFAPRGRLEAYAWFRVRDYEEEDLGTRFQLEPDEIWLYDAMTAPDLRGLGIYPEFLRGVARLLAREGFSRILIVSEAANRNSLRAHCAAGAVPVSTFSALRLCGFTRVRDEGRSTTRWFRPGQRDVTRA